MDQATKTIRAEHLDWAQKLHDSRPLPKLDDSDLQLRKDAHQAYQNLVDESRKEDPK